VRVNCSGRTDSGVHAIGQVVNFHSNFGHAPDDLLRAVNSNLPTDVVIREASVVSPAFDANRDAVRKMYRYVIHDGHVHDVFLRRYSWHSKRRLDAAAMMRASAPLMGRHDFHSFETEWPNRLTSVRTILHLQVNRIGDFIYIDVEADGFLYNMVRAIAGTLINVGRGYWPEKIVAEILQAADRRQAGPTAPAEGLFLVRVTYPAEINECGSQSP
jgi:tRNA pseudouridine38-40 synthase